MTQPNLYEFLGVARDANTEQINKAFREKALLLHPDKNKTNPDAAQQFKLLTQAYQILTDPHRRKKYDDTLPPPPGEAQRITDLAQLWKEAGRLFFEQLDRFTPAVDAVRYSFPITLEQGKLLIVGIESTKANLIGYLNPSITHNHMRRLISELYGSPLDFRVISGTTVAEWESIRDGEDKVRQRRLNVRAAADAEVSETDLSTLLAAAENWDDVFEILGRQWAAAELRAYPQSRARYALSQLALVARVEDTSRAAGMAEEVLQRHLARALERIANLSSIESGVIGLEYLRYKARLLGGV